MPDIGLIGDKWGGMKEKVGMKKRTEKQNKQGRGGVMVVYVYSAMGSILKGGGGCSPNSRCAAVCKSGRRLSSKVHQAYFIDPCLCKQHETSPYLAVRQLVKTLQQN